MMEEDAGNVNDQLPLLGVVLCCTSFAQDVRTKLANFATQMGAEHKLDLTSDVTHLIAGNTQTPKYRYVAKERPDIKVLHQDWLEAVRQSWMEGGDVNVKALEERHKLPVFHDLHVCLTGFDDMEQRTFLSRTVEREGAEYHGDLTRKVTHLIALAPQGAKYTHAKLWGISVVSRKWFEDSVARGMALDESLYDPALPLEEQGEGAFITAPKPKKTSLGKRPREGESQTAEDPGKRKLRRTASSRLNSQSQDMWHGISARDVALEPSESDQWRDDEEANEATVAPQRPRIHVRKSEISNHSMSGPTAAEDGLFSGRYILIYGFPREKARRVQEFLEPNGACVVHSSSELERASESLFFRSRYLLVPHTVSMDGLELPEVPAGTQHVTEWWVERCIHHKRFLDPADDPLSRPLWDAHIPSLVGVTVATTGFTGVDFRQTAECLKLMGSTYEEKLTTSVSILISGSDIVKKEKAYYAWKHGIPVVSIGWVWECLKAKQRVPHNTFRIKTSASDTTLPSRGSSMSSRKTAEAVQRNPNTSDRMRDAAEPPRLSNTTKPHVTPTLSIQPSRSPPQRAPRSGPFIHEDEDDVLPPQEEDNPASPSFALSPRRFQPLQELPPNISPRRASQEEGQATHFNREKPLASEQRLTPPPPTAPRSPKSLHRTISPLKEEQQPLPPAPKLHEELTANLASILHQHMSSRPESRNADIPPRRKSRPLGRSTSGIGSRSASASMRSEHQGPSPGGPPGVQASLADGFTPQPEDTLPPAGTQLGYEAADAEQHRLLMEKRLKTKLQDGTAGRRVASVGVVKDSVDGDAGVGNRVRGRHRAAR